MKLFDLELAIQDIKIHSIRQWLIVAFTDAYLEARKGKLATVDEAKFDINSNWNILQLVDSTLERTYRPGGSIAFVIFEPMVREIFAAPFRDRTIHHFLNWTQGDWWDRRFIADNYSCRLGKGTLYGINRLRHHIQSASDNFTKPTIVIKRDIQGYFMSIPRQKLLDRILQGIERQFAPYINHPEAKQLKAICQFLWTKVIMDDPVKTATRRGPLSNWAPNILPPSKSLFAQPPGKGLVIGNQTSQLGSNIYLDQLDQFITKDLGIKHYGRYVDDFYMVVQKSDYPKTKQKLKYIETFLSENLDLTLHPKKRYEQDIKKGVSFVGARIYPHCIYPSDRLQTNFKKAIKSYLKGSKNYDSVQAYLGLMKHQNSEKFIRETLEELGLSAEFFN